MEQVRVAAEAATPDGERIEHVDVTIRILHFCFDWGETQGDLDNIAKPIIDAMCLVTIFNDNQAKEILLRRTDLLRVGITEVLGATPLLAERIGRALAEETPRLGFVYVAVDTVVEHGRLQ